MYVFLMSSTLMVAQEHKASKILTDYFASLNSGNKELLGSLLTEDFKVMAPFSPTALDKKSWIGTVLGFKAAFPDLNHQIISWFADDNMIADRGVFTGSNTGSFMGNPPTNNKVVLPYTSIFELNGKGQIKSIDIKFDNKLFESQLIAGIPDVKMRAEKTIRDLFEAMDAGQTEKFAGYCSADFMISNPFLPAPAPLAAFQGILQSQKISFPDFKHQIVEIHTDGKSVTTMGNFIGTNTGPMMGNPPTGSKVNIPFLVLDQMDNNGKIKMRNVLFDSKLMETQLMAGMKK